MSTRTFSEATPAWAKSSQWIRSDETDTVKSCKRPLQQSVRFEITTSPTAATASRSTSHQFSPGLSVWVTEPWS